jgi:DNA-binding transcriptional ArsR family regulator
VTATPPPFPPVRIASGPVFELIAELAAFTSGPARASLESGKAWIREVRALAGPELIHRVEGWGISLFAELASFALDAGQPYEPDRLAQYLRAVKPETLRRRLLGAESVPNRAMVSEGAFDRALAGDAKARRELRRVLGGDATFRQSLDRLLTTPPAKVREDIATIVEAWATRVLPAFWDQARTLIERDVEPKEGLLHVTGPRDALRVFTNGVDVDPTDWASEVMVVPTVALRPFIVPMETGARLILLCSVADESFDVDPAAPPRRLVQVATALGDELRLRILRELARGEATATELAERLAVERTSLHHHLGILRSAGLVAIRAEGAESWHYSLRAESVSNAGAALAGYLGTDRPRA